MSNATGRPTNVYVEYAVRAGRAMAHVLFLPGCFSKGDTVQQALDSLPAAVKWYTSWLERHGEPPSEAGPDFRVVEQVVGGGAMGSGSRVAIFTPDLQPVDDAALECHLQLMDYSRQDVVALVRALPLEGLLLQKAPGQRPVKEILRHIAAAEQWYLTRLWKVERFEPQKDVVRRLEVVRAAARRCLRGATRADRSREVLSWRERWTMRKVLRRFVEHEIEHLLELCDLLAPGPAV